MSHAQRTGIVTAVSAQNVFATTEEVAVTGRYAIAAMFAGDEIEVGSAQVDVMVDVIAGWG
jgi:hypothetical protein